MKNKLEKLLLLLAIMGCASFSCDTFSKYTPFVKIPLSEMTEGILTVTGMYGFMIAHTFRRIKEGYEISNQKSNLNY